MATDLQTLLSTPEEQRDSQWEGRFLTSFVTSKVDLVFPDPKPGPDSWPYLFVHAHDNAKEPVKDVLGWLAEKGVGLSLNPHKEMPDYIMPYGMIWFYRETGRFLSEHFQFRSKKIEIQNGKQYYTGEPSRSYIPEYVRVVLREFMRQQSVLNPRVCMLSEDQQYWDLCFSLESLGNPPSHEHAGIAEALSWFFPGHYSIVIISESAIGSFYPL